MKITKELTFFERWANLSGKHLPVVVGIFTGVLFLVTLLVVTAARAGDIRDEMEGIFFQSFQEVVSDVQAVGNNTWEDRESLYCAYQESMFQQDDLEELCTSSLRSEISLTKHSFIGASMLLGRNSERLFESGNVLIFTFSDDEKGYLEIPVHFLPENNSDIASLLWNTNLSIARSAVWDYTILTGYWDGFDFVAVEIENQGLVYQSPSGIPEDAELITYSAGYGTQYEWDRVIVQSLSKAYGNGSYTAIDFIDAWKDADMLMKDAFSETAFSESTTGWGEPGFWIRGSIFSLKVLGIETFEDEQDISSLYQFQLAYCASCSPLWLAVKELFRNGTILCMLVIYLVLGFFMVNQTGELRKKEIQPMTDELARQKKALDYARDAEASRREMTSAIAHELKTPIAVLSSYSEALQENIDATKQAHYLSVIRQETERMDRMVLELLDLSRLEAGRYQLHRENFDMVELVQEILQPLDGQIQEKELEIQWQVGEQMVHADRYRLGQVVENYLTNAIRHTPRGGKIVLRLGMNHETLSVENQGKQIPQEQLSKVWETFWQGDQSRNQRGSGLGLAICKSIMLLHGGSCKVENTSSGVRFSANVQAAGLSGTVTNMPKEKTIKLQYPIAQEYTTVERLFLRLGLLDGVALRQEIRAGNILHGVKVVDDLHERLMPGSLVTWQDFRITVVRDERTKRQALIFNQFQVHGRLTSNTSNLGSTHDMS